ncbi:glycine oxidase [Synechococcus sp. RS9909]|uniref:glycine oxidase ThiO n=1 Tax=unclassified Synechococcus TaxID=2626047 RepID=UPI00006907C2|nr:MULTISPECIES: glycine oxidase ThiO [unclassified Synechococcus]EAQ70468.1 putative thiamine biosynthesis oxidoreductase [Synechococcus sp. RS9917]QNI80660.1 glycine oxidase [Synechococcus sp. RS9909]
MAGEPVVILGGGLIGLAVAHQLARRGRAVTVLSRRRSEAAGFVAAGMLAPHAEGLVGDQLTLGQRSLDRIPRWVAQIEADSGLPCGWRSSGIIVPFQSAAERDRYPTVACGQALNREQLEQELPGLAPAWSAGLLFEQDGQIDNRRQLMRALESACVDRGVRFLEGVEVLALEQSGGGLQGARVRDAEGHELSLECAAAVLCCGAWSAQLLPELPVFPVKGQMLSLQAPRGALKRVIFGPGTYLVPREDGLLVVGATSEPEAGFAEGLTPQGQRTLQQGIASLLPEATHWPPMERWWGFRPCTPDEGPLLGPSPIEGLWLACGHHRNGVLMAGLTAELLAGVITGQPLDADTKDLLQAFRWDRFASVQPQTDQPSVRQP